MRPLLVLLAAALLVGCADAAPTSPGPTAPDATGAVPPLHPAIDHYGETVLEVDGTELAVLVADVPEERRHGLMEVEELPDGVGMVFVYDEDREGSFTMANTLVPLSIAFVSADGTILEILEMEPCPEGDDCPSYSPDTAYRYAIEVPAGWFDRHGIGPGAAVDGLGPLSG